MHDVCSMFCLIVPFYFSSLSIFLIFYCSYLFGSFSLVLILITQCTWLYFQDLLHNSFNRSFYLKPCQKLYKNPFVCIIPQKLWTMKNFEKWKKNSFHSYFDFFRVLTQSRGLISINLRLCFRQFSFDFFFFTEKMNKR